MSRRRETRAEPAISPEIGLAVLRLTIAALGFGFVAVLGWAVLSINEALPADATAAALAVVGVLAAALGAMFAFVRRMIRNGELAEGTPALTIAVFTLVSLLAGAAVSTYLPGSSGPDWYQGGARAGLDVVAVCAVTAVGAWLGIVVAKRLSTPRR